MVRQLRLLVVLFSRCICSRRDLLLENLALRQQLRVLERRHPKPRFATSDKLFWVILRRLWPRWKRVLTLVQPETVVRWHRAGFKLYWTRLSRHRTSAGRKCVSKQMRDLIFRMVAENPTWGAPRILRGLKILGFEVSERTVVALDAKGSTRAGRRAIATAVLPFQQPPIDPWLDWQLHGNRHTTLEIP